jgi:hypothetical protein
VDNRELTYENLLSLLLDSNKPLSYFGKKLESFDQSKAFLMFKNYLRGSAIMTVDMRNLWFSAKKSIDYKVYLIERIKTLMAKLGSDA